MVKVITYGTFDLLHEGHIRLLKRAKKLGDYLIVGITSDTFDKSRGKINVVQSLSERIDGVRKTGLADEIIVEEYDGQKIDDIKRLGVDIFTVGSDWKGKFDYLKEYCKVVYLERTKGISSSDLRSEERSLRIGLVGKENFVFKFAREAGFVNGAKIIGLYFNHVDDIVPPDMVGKISVFDSYEKMLEVSDAVYIASSPEYHYAQIKEALEKDKHVLCESPICLSTKEWKELKSLAESKGLVLLDSLKTAYSTAYSRLLLLAKEGTIGDLVSITSTSTSLRPIETNKSRLAEDWSSIFSWGPIDLLPVFQLFGCDYKDLSFATRFQPNTNFDLFTKINLIYPHATAVTYSGIGIKSEGELVIAGTKGYIYVPAPWWKTDYFEVRYEDPNNNQKFFYPLEGEGIRYEILSFIKTINEHKDYSYISDEISYAFVKIFEEFRQRKNLYEL
jgi:choline-phosphate cytidylyltransferase